MLKDLVAFANHLDSIGLTKEADEIDALLQKASWLSNPADYFPQLDEKIEIIKESIQGFLSKFGITVSDEGELKMEKTANNKSGQGLLQLSKHIKVAMEVVSYIWNGKKGLRMFAALVTGGLIGGAYVASPLDLIPDPVLGFGQIDDFIIFINTIKYSAKIFDNKNWNEATKKIKSITPDNTREDDAPSDNNDEEDTESANLNDKLNSSEPPEETTGDSQNEENSIK